MSDVTVVLIDEMEPIHGGVARRARASLGVTSWGMHVLTLPPEWDGYTTHNHAPDAFDPNQEEVYVPLEGRRRSLRTASATSCAPGVMARVAPTQLRRIVPGADGIRLLALGGRPGAFDAPSWTELGAPPPGE